MPDPKKLRKNSTDAERKLWRMLRSRQLESCKFRRQEPVGKYVVDFICYEKRLIVEVDGGQHLDRQEQDEERNLWLESQGFQVIRFWNNQVLKETDLVLQVISRALQKPPHPGLLPQGEKES